MARDYTLILGMPGTGKTSTIVAAVKRLVAQGSSVLIMAYTNRHAYLCQTAVPRLSLDCLSMTLYQLSWLLSSSRLRGCFLPMLYFCRAAKLQH